MTTLFRAKKNGKLYTIERVSPKAYPGSWYEATPYKHNEKLYPRKKHVDLDEFEVVAEL